MTRVCFVSRVRPDRLDEYRRRHAAVWPEMLEALRDSGWRDYHLYLTRTGSSSASSRPPTSPPRRPPWPRPP